MKKVLFKIEEKTNGYLDVSFSGQISKTGVVKNLMGLVSVGFTVFAVVQHYVH